MIKLSELQAAIAASTTGDWTECCADQPESHPCRLIHHTAADYPLVVLESGDSEHEPRKADVCAIVALHNAAPVLLAIACTALAFEQAKRAAAKVHRAYHESGLDSLLPGVEATDLDETNCRTAYLDALDKVEP